jgi:hypothetical protein
MLALYELALEAKQQLLLTRPGEIGSPSGVPSSTASEDPLANFKPKSHEDYLAHIVGRTMKKTRRHEALIRAYGTWVASRSFTVSTTEHPKDLVLRQGVEEWLIEAKVLYHGNATHAVRAALGQLFTYRYELYDGKPPPRLVALFTESVGDRYVAFLNTCGIDSVWWDEAKWAGSSGAVADGLAV